MRKFTLAALVATLWIVSAASAQQIVVTPAKTSGIYTIGEKIGWTVTVTGGKSDAVHDVTYALKPGGGAVSERGKLDLAGGSTTVETTLNKPNTVLLVVQATVAGKPVRALGGAVAAPAGITRSAPCPEDFDAFWKAKIKALRAIPPNPVIEPADSKMANVDYAKVTLDNINGTHVYGQIAHPKRAGKFPALLEVQYAGVYGLPKWNVTSRAHAGWLAMDIMAHDLPLDRDKQFYKDQANGPLKGYTRIGDDDRDQCYFLRMYLGCVRAVDYLATRSDWDGKTIVVMGASQGGQQALITAGLCPNVTAVLALVPAGCDTTGMMVGRGAGFPFYGRGQLENNPKIVETGMYFDAVNFAPHIKCPALVGTGLIDETCPPVGVLTAFNLIAGPKEIVILPLSDHHGRNNAHAAYNARAEQWLKELVKGKTPEPKLTAGYAPPSPDK